MRLSIPKSTSLLSASEVCDAIEAFLDDKKAEDILRVDLKGKSTIADFMVIASGSSRRHIQSTGELLKRHLYDLGVKPIFIEGAPQCDWVLLDAGVVIVHLFRPEVREFYNLEKMWGVELADFSRKIARDNK